MNRWPPTSLAALSRVLYTHNPFYLVSALLVLYGLHRSIGPASPWSAEAVTIACLFGYTMLLALMAFAIVRFGGVWDDARTIMLAIVLLFLAISVRFDVIALRNPGAGAALLAAGFAFAAITTEGLLRGLGIRLSALYRAPYYLLLAILFAYPAWLAKLSVDGHDMRMSSGVFLFPVVAGAALLTLWPAARRGRPPVANTGTPWQWPWYPWALFAVLWVAIALRSYSLSMAFQAGRAPDVAFRPYFLIPLGLAGALLLFELALAGGYLRFRTAALLAPMGLLAMAFPGQGGNRIAVEFLDQLCAHVSSPAQLTLTAIIAFYAMAWMRGIERAQWGVFGGLAALSVVDTSTLSIHTLTAPAAWPLLLVAVAQLAIAWRRDQSWRALLAVSIVLGLAWNKQLSAWPSPLGVFVIAHALFVAALVTGLVWNDRAAQILRRCAAFVIPAACTLVLATYGVLFRDVPASAIDSYLFMLPVIAAIYWYHAATVPNLVGALASVGLVAISEIRHLPGIVGRSAIANGLPWLLAGLLFLLVAAGISTTKGGGGRLLGRMLVRLNDRLRRAKQARPSSLE